MVIRAGDPMPVTMLTDRFARSAKPQAGQRQTDYFDEATKGLSLCASAGGGRTFFLHYTRHRDGKRVRMKLGLYGDISLAQARQLARDARAAVGEGKDPASERRSDEASLRVRDLVESYVARHAATQRSANEIARRLRKNVAEVIGDVTLARLHRRDLTRCIDKVKDRGAAVEANRVFEDLRAMVRWARGRGDLDQNLMEGMRRPAETAARDRVLSLSEIKQLWHGLPAAKMQEGTRRTLKLCLITTGRVGEVSGMCVSELDLARRLWTIPAHRSKNKRAHTLPLSDLAVELIEAQLIELRDGAARRESRLARRIARLPQGRSEVAATIAAANEPEWIFPGPGSRGPITVFAVAKAIERSLEQFGIEAFTSHDLRRTAATRMEEIGISPFIIAHVLGHISVTKASVTSKVYARYGYEKEKREAVDKWAAHLLGIIGEAAAVLPLSGRGRK
jgi:integrase